MTGATKSPEPGTSPGACSDPPASTARSQPPAVEIELDLFSGRPNPALELDQNNTRLLARRLARLPPAGAAGRLEPPGLGYRGVQLRGGVTLDSPEHDVVPPIRVFGGVVHQGAAVLADPGRGLERWLLEILRQGVTASLRPVVEETLRAL